MNNKEEFDLVPLSEETIKEKLSEFPGWEYKENKISKTFEFSSFDDGLTLIIKLAPFCNKIDHHPDIHIMYKKIRFDLQRFSAGGKVVERDFTVAERIEELYKN